MTVYLCAITSLYSFSTTQFFKLFNLREEHRVILMN